MPKIFQNRTGAGFVLSYLIVLLIVIGIGILATVRLDQISASVDNLTNNLAADMLLSKEIVSQTLLTRFYANKYISTQSQTDLDHFNAEFAELAAFLGQAGQQITDPERVEMLNRIESAVSEYGDTFNRVVELVRERQRIQSQVLDVQELLIKNQLTSLRIHVISLNDPMAFLALGNAQNAFQLMRLNTVKYLEEGDERYVVLFKTGRQQAQTAFASLEITLQDPVQRENATDAKIAIAAYSEGFDTIHADYVELKYLFRTKLDVLEPEIGTAAAEIVDSIEREFETQNEFAQILISQTRLVLLATTMIAVLTGLGLGIMLNRRIIERAQAEKSLREAHDRLEIRVKERTAELEQANEEVKQFAYIVSHDLRAPLVNLKGFASELRYALKVIDPVVHAALPHLDEQQRQDVTLAFQEDVPEALGFIDSSATRMDHFINALLKLSRLGRRELHPETVDMEALVQATLETLGHQIEERQGKATVGSLPEVVADRISMEQIVGNLLGNAVKYLVPDRPAELEITAERGAADT
ncbi:MAG: histidine kinase dimerization/phospho-acceptor domain-containing protein, partial [Chloroflexota bacterium]|nr:histidine kinase dimerization/phospho-acceptor domain-containing protein [Chloroflexota bacterium]